MPLHPRTCSLLYSVSCLLDALDGLAARHFEQSTDFGTILDMVTDRCTTACLLVFLASAFPRWSIIFQGLISLDLASHYTHMYASANLGRGSHKNMKENPSWLLRHYYTNKVRPDTLLHETVDNISGVANYYVDDPLHLLRLERTLLHRALSALLFLPVPLPDPPRGIQCSVLPATRHPCITQALAAVHQPVVGGRHGNGTVSIPYPRERKHRLTFIQGEQDGLKSPLDPCRRLFPRHVPEAIHQRDPAHLCQQAAR